MTSYPPPPPSPYYSSRDVQASSGRRKYTEKDYEDIFYHFDDYAKEVIMSNASRFIDPTEPAEHYEYEEQIMEELSEFEMEGMKKSFYFGFASTVSSFLLLRMRRRMSIGGLSKYASSNRRSGGYKFDPIHQQPSNNMQTSTKPSRSGFFVDVALSAVLGMGLSLLALENDMFYPTGNSSAGDDNDPPLTSIIPPPQWISHQIPLVPGKSLVSETLCKPLTEEFKKFPKELWQSGNHRGIENGYNNHIALYANGGWKDTKYYNSNPNASVVSLGEKHNGNERKVENNKHRIYEHLVVDSLQGFVINCERRARYEKKLRKLKRIPKNAYPLIPYDGVPANEELELDDIYLMEDSGDGGDNEYYK